MWPAHWSGWCCYRPYWRRWRVDPAARWLARILFSQTRVGRSGKPFRIWKFRTMRTGAAGARSPRRVTAGDPHRSRAAEIQARRTASTLQRRSRGDMSLIGPRPEMPEYVNRESPMWQAVLQVPPGITDLATSSIATKRRC